MSWFLFLLMLWAIGLVSWWPLRAWQNTWLFSYYCDRAVEEVLQDEDLEAYWRQLDEEDELQDWEAWPQQLRSFYAS